MDWQKHLVFILVGIIFNGTRQSLSHKRDKPADKLKTLVSYWHVGCFKDQRNSRALPDRIDSVPNSKDIVEQCAKATMGLGFHAFGVQWQKECWTGVNAILSYKKYGGSDKCQNGRGFDLANDVYFLSNTSCLAGYGRKGHGECKLCKPDHYRDESMNRQKCQKCSHKFKTWGRKGVTSMEGCTERNPIYVSDVVEAVILYGVTSGTIVARVKASYSNGSLVIPPLLYSITGVSVTSNERPTPRKPKHDRNGGRDGHSQAFFDFFKIVSATGDISITEKFNFTDGLVYDINVQVSDSGNDTIGYVRNRQARARVTCKDSCKKSRPLYGRMSGVCPKMNITRQALGDNTSTLLMKSDDMTLIYEVSLKREIEPGNYSLHIQSGLNSSLSMRFNVMETSKGKHVIRGSPQASMEVQSPNLTIKLYKLDNGRIAQAFNEREGVTLVGIPKDINCSSVPENCMRSLVAWKKEAHGTGNSDCMEDADLMYRRYGRCIAPPVVSIRLDNQPTAAGTSVTLICNVTSLIEYTFEWYYNGRRKPNMDTEVYTMDATVYNQGYYKCVATNLVGSQSAQTLLLTVPDYFTTYVFFKTKKRGQSIDDVASKVEDYLQTKTDTPNKYLVKGKNSASSGRDMEIVVYGKKKDNEDIVKYHQNLKTSLLQGISDELKKLKIKKSTLKIKSADYCFPEVSGKESIKGEFKWNLTRIGKWSEPVACPYNKANSARRYCSGRFNTGSVWELPEDDSCSYASKRTQKLEDISKKKINRGNAKKTANELKDVVTKTPGQDLNEADASLVADTLANLVGNVETLNETGLVIVEVVSYIMEMDEKALANSQQASTKILDVVNTLPGVIPLQDGEDSKEIVTKFIILQINQVNSSSFNGLSFSKGSAGSVKLPSVIFENSAPGSSYRVGFVNYKNHKLFQVNEENDLEDDEDDKEGNQTMSDVVLSSSVYNTTIRGLSKPLVLTFPKPKNDMVPQKCVYWMVEERVWSSKGCNLTDAGSCECDHMTSFAVIFKPPGQADRAADDPLTVSLTIISYVGCALSLAGVLLTLLTFSLFRHLRKTNQQPIIINLCIALGLLLIVFLAGASRPKPRVGCQVVAMLLHYLSLAVVTWMGVEGYNLYLQIIQVMATYQRKFMYKAAVVAWGVPAVIVAVTAVVSAVERREMSDKLYYYGNETVCVLFEPTYYWASWFAPILLILSINVIIYILVVHKLGCTGAMVNPEKKSLQRYRLRTALAIMCLLGLTWLFGALSFGDKYQRLVFEYLFCIFNSLQGLFIFIFHCVRIKEVRNQWRFFLSGHGISYRGTTDSFQRSKGIGESHHSSEAPYAKVKHWITTRDSDRSKRKDTISTVVGPSNSIADPKDFCNEDEVHVELGPLKERDNSALESSDNDKGKTEA